MHLYILSMRTVHGENRKLVALAMHCTIRGTLRWVFLCDCLYEQYLGGTLLRAYTQGFHATVPCLKPPEPSYSLTLCHYPDGDALVPILSTILFHG